MSILYAAVIQNNQRCKSNHQVRLRRRNNNWKQNPDRTNSGPLLTKNDSVESSTIPDSFKCGENEDNTRPSTTNSDCTESTNDEINCDDNPDADSRQLNGESTSTVPPSGDAYSEYSFERATDSRTTYAELPSAPTAPESVNNSSEQRLPL